MAKMTKAPKPPKKSASAKAWKNYDERYKAWEKKHKQKLADEKHKEALIRKYKG